MKTSRLLLLLILLSGLFIWGCSSKTDNPVEFSKKAESKILIIYNVDLIKSEEGKLYLKPQDGYHFEYLEKYSKGDHAKLVSDLKLGARINNVSKVVIELIDEKPKYLFYEPGEELSGKPQSALLKKEPESRLAVD